jgi:HTH-type transcriptional regulator/antitoxin HipB
VNSPAYDAAIRVLVEARTKAGLTQRDLAARLHTRQSVISRLEAKGRSVTLLEFIAIAEALGRQPHELLSEVLAAIPAGTTIGAFPQVRERRFD